MPVSATNIKSDVGSVTPDFLPEKNTKYARMADKPIINKFLILMHINNCSLTTGKYQKYQHLTDERTINNAEINSELLIAKVGLIVLLVKVYKWVG
jgi:hypothetical protein